MNKYIAVIITSLFAASVNAATMTSTCEEYYKEMDNHMVKMKEMGNQEAQVNMLKQQIDQAKVQMAALPEATQNEACTQGLNALKQAKEAAGMK